MTGDHPGIGLPGEASGRRPLMRPLLRWRDDDDGGEEGGEVQKKLNGQKIKG